MERAIPIYNGKHDWQVLVYDDTGRVIINQTIPNRTADEMTTWREKHEDESWVSVTINRK